jgi:large subunit ribosomal protein L29
MKTSDLRSKTVEELQTELTGLTQERFNLRMQKGLEQAPKTSNIKAVRRNIARIKTILNEKMREGHERKE